MAIVQLHNDTEGRPYYRRKLAAGKTPMEALCALKRRLSDIVYRQLVADQKPNADQQRGRAREDKWGRLLAARPTPTPTSTLRRSHFPDPPVPKLRPRPRPAQTQPRPVPGALFQRRPAATGAPSTGGNNQLVDTVGSHERALPRLCGDVLSGIRPVMLIRFAPLGPMGAANPAS